jgi:hypothetical protein
MPLSVVADNSLSLMMLLQMRQATVGMDSLWAVAGHIFQVTLALVKGGEHCSAPFSGNRCCLTDAFEAVCSSGWQVSDEIQRHRLPGCRLKVWAEVVTCQPSVHVMAC